MPTFAPDFLERLSRLRFTPGRLKRGAGEGEHPSGASGHAVEFRDRRAYAPGDDPRMVDWNVYARSGRLVVKEFFAEENIEVALGVDTSLSMEFGDPPKRAWAARLAGALGFLSLHLRHPVRLLAPGRPPAGPFAGPASVPDLFRAADGLAVSPAAADLRALFDRSAGTRALRIAISDLWDAEVLRAAAAASARSGAGVVLVHLLSPEEADPPLSGWVRLRDAETGRTVDRWVGEEERTAYRTLLAGVREEWSRFAAGAGAVYVPASTSVPVEEFLTVGLREAGVLA